MVYHFFTLIYAPFKLLKQDTIISTKYDHKRTQDKIIRSSDSTIWEIIFTDYSDFSPPNYTGEEHSKPMFGHFLAYFLHINFFFIIIVL